MIPALTRTEIRIFSAVVGHPHSSMSDLADMLGLCRSGVARRIYRLERLGLIVTELIHVDASRSLPPVNLRICNASAWVLEAPRRTA